MRLKRLSLVLSLVAVIAFTGEAFAQRMVMVYGPGGGPLFGGPPPFMMLLRTANLTPSQQNQVRQILQADRAEMDPLFKQLHSTHEQIADKLLSAGPLNASDLTALQQQAARVQQRIDTQQLNTALKIRALLTPDQLSRVAQVHQKLRSLNQQIEAIIGPPGPPGPPVGPAPDPPMGPHD